MFSSGVAPGGLGRRFHQVLASVVVSSLGDGMRFVSLPLLAAQVTGDARQIAAVSLAEQLPWLLLGLPAGALADRLDRRHILWRVDAARAVLAGGFAAAVALGAITVPLLVAVAFLLGCGQTLYNGAWAGMVPALVPPEQLGRANGRLQAGSLISDTLLGSPLGAWLFGVAAVAPFAVDGASFAAASLLVLLLPGRYHPRERSAGTDAATNAGATVATSTNTAGGTAGGGGLAREVVEGVRWLAAHRLLRRLCIVSGAATLVTSGLIAVLVLFARRELGLGGVGFGLLVAAFAVGGLVGALIAPRAAAAVGRGPFLTGATLASAARVGAAGAVSSAVVGALLIGGFGLASTAWSVVSVTTRQSLVPTELLGRVTTSYQVVIGGAGALGALGAGLAAHAWGLRAPFYTGAALLALAALIPLTDTPAPPRRTLRPHQHRPRSHRTPVRPADPHTR